MSIIACAVRSLAVIQSASRRDYSGDRGTRFTLDGKPTFLLGISYYGGLGASQDFVRRDLDDMQRHGFNWLRVWATWSSADQDVSAVDSEGHPREPFLGRLQWLVAECDRRGLVVDVTLTRGAQALTGVPRGRLPDLAAHQQAVATLVAGLKAYRNWYLDLGNERDVRDGRYVPIAELKTLREQVRRLDPQRLVTASFGGHDLSESDVRESIVTAGLDFLCPHRPRNAQSPGQTESKTRELLAMMSKMGRAVPVHYQEPFRRGYTSVGACRRRLPGRPARRCGRRSRRLVLPQRQPARDTGEPAATLLRPARAAPVRSA